MLGRQACRATGGGHLAMLTACSPWAKCIRLVCLPLSEAKRAPSPQTRKPRSRDSVCLTLRPGSGPGGLQPSALRAGPSTWKENAVLSKSKTPAEAQGQGQAAGSDPLASWNKGQSGSSVRHRRQREPRGMLQLGEGDFLPPPPSPCSKPSSNW